MSETKDFKAEETNLSEDQKKQMEMMENIETPKDSIEFGAEVTAKVVSISGDSVFVDISLKNEAILAKSEVTDAEGVVTVKEGDEIKLFVISVSADEVLVSKSLKKGKATKQMLRLMVEKAIPVEGRVTGMNKGGFNVTILGKKAFCPFSAIDLVYPENPVDYMGKDFEFIIARIENRANNIVLTRLPLLSGDLSETFETLDAAAESGDPVTGVVTRTTNFGAFVDLGGVEGLVHVSELTWDRDEQTEEIVKTGQKISVKVLKVERKESLRDSRISLSMKRLEEDPWQSKVAKLSAGDKVEATVSRIVGFGAFVRLFAGVEALIRTSDMSWERVRKPSDVVKKDQKLEVTIVNIDLENRKIDCSIKDDANDPWADASEKYAVGTKVTGTVADQKEYGFFVDLDDSITGLLPNRRIAKEKIGSVSKGDSIEVTIDTLDLETRKIALSYGDVPEYQPRTGGKSSGGSNSDAAKYMKEQEAKANSGESEFAFMLKNAFKK